MKKLLALLMVCGFALTFVACGGGEQQSQDDTTTPDTETPEVQSDTTETMESDTTSTTENDTIQ